MKTAKPSYRSIFHEFTGVSEETERRLRKTVMQLRGAALEIRDDAGRSSCLMMLAAGLDYMLNDPMAGDFYMHMPLPIGVDVGGGCTMTAELSTGDDRRDLPLEEMRGRFITSLPPVGVSTALPEGMTFYLELAPA